MQLPTDLSGGDLRKALEKVGFVFQRQKGSHMILLRESQDHVWLFQPTDGSARGRFGRFFTKRASAWKNLRSFSRPKAYPVFTMVFAGVRANTSSSKVKSGFEKPRFFR